MILVTEEAIEHALHFQPGPSGKDTFEVAESEKKMKTFDWDKVLAMNAKPESQWIFGSDKTTPQGIPVHSLTNEAHGRELYLPRHIRCYMERAHYVGNLTFSCLITQLDTEAGVIWMATDERPTVTSNKKEIPHGDWPGLEFATKRQGRQQPAPSTEAGPSASAPSASAPSDSAAPPAFLQPLYSLIHQLSDDIAYLEGRNQRHFEQLECRNQRCYEHLRRLIISGGTDFPPEPHTPSDQSEEEEAQHDEPKEARDPPADGGDDASDDSFHST
ncbi:hypothetical protein AHAS_Ahas15G0330100 [Arachis hypogaea]